MIPTIDVLSTVTPANDAPGPPQGRWTYADYAALPDDGRRYELIDGVLFMTPALSTEHQGTSARFVTYLMNHVEFAGIGRVFAAPVDVELAPDTVVQPDVIVILNANLARITPSRIVGPPDLVVEVMSPSTAGYDRREKQDAYAVAGVREYSVADPSAQTVELLVLDQGDYRSQGVFRGQATLPSQVVPQLPVPVARLFGGEA